LNSPASAPHTSSSRWSIRIGIIRAVPFGTFTPQMSAPSAFVNLGISVTGPYSLSVSCSTMVTSLSLKGNGWLR
jgi:hypothetical protein